MTEDKNSTGRTVVQRALEYGWKIATIVLAIWTIVGPPSIRELVHNGSLSSRQAAVAWAGPTLCLWGLAWWRRRQLSLAVRQRYVSAIVGLSGPVAEDLTQILSAHVGLPENGGAVQAVGARQEGEPALAKRESGDEIAELSANASYVLFLALKTCAQDDCQQAEVALWPELIRSDLWGVGDPLSRACRELEIAGLLTEIELSPDGQSLRAVSADRLAGRREVSRIMELLDQHLRETYFWDSDDTIIP